MAFGSSNAEDVTFRYPPRRDTFQQLIPGSGIDIVVPGCLFAPVGGNENDVHAHQVRADATLYAPDDAPALSAQDQVVIRGDIYDVIEKPKLWAGEGYEIPVRLVTG